MKIICNQWIAQRILEHGLLLRVVLIQVKDFQTLDFYARADSRHRQQAIAVALKDISLTLVVGKYVWHAH
jgi:hypothetical protein